MAAKPHKENRPQVPVKRHPMGLFWVGFCLVTLSLVLMIGRNYESYLNWQELQKMVDAPDVFRQLHEKFPSFTKPLEPKLARSKVTIYPQDPSTGDRDAKVQIVVFNDPSCTACMSIEHKILDIRRAHGDDVRVIYKFFPSTTGVGSMDAAVFGEIAQSKGVFWLFHDRLIEAGLGETQAYAELLEKLGVPLSEQREILKKEIEFLVRRVDTHMADAKKLGLDAPPAIFVNAYRIGQEKLPLDGLATYVQRLLDDQPIVAVSAEE